MQHISLGLQDRERSLTGIQAGEVLLRGEVGRQELEEPGLPTALGGVLEPSHELLVTGEKIGRAHV